MKNFVLKNKYFFILTLIIISAISFALFFNFKSAKAEEKPTTFLPYSAVENYSLSNPLGASTDGENFAVILNVNTLAYYLSGDESYTVVNGFTTLGQVIISTVNGEKCLLLSDNGSIFSIPFCELDSFDISQKNNYYKAGGNFFALNGDYLVSVFQSNGTIYSLNDFNSPTSQFSCDGNKPVAMNGENQIFYGDSEGVKKLENSVTTLFSEVSPSSMIATDSDVYYIALNKIYRKSISGGQTVELQFENSDYELGNITPYQISFKGENLLIVDKDGGTIQEYFINDNKKLEFTGFAIAKNKTAFNRITANAIDVERFYDKIAVLDDNKLTVFNEKDFNPYSKNSFYNFNLNFFQNKGIDNLPIKFALGNENVLLGFGGNKISLLDYKKNSLSSSTGISGVIADICYQSGVYYLLTTYNEAGSDTPMYSIYTLNEKETACSLLTGGQGTPNAMTVDVFKNIYIGTEAKIYKLEKSDYTQKITLFETGVDKICTDLNGNLFALIGGNIKMFNGVNFTDFTVSGFESEIKSFAMAYDKKEICFLINGEEKIFKYSGLPNCALNEVDIPSDYKTTDSSADINNLAFYTVSEGANVYKVVANSSKFDFVSLENPEEQYIYLGKTEKSGYPSLYILLGKDSAFLVNKNECEALQIEMTDISSEKYISTGVYAYYLPVLSKSNPLNQDQTNSINEYVLTENEAKIRLDKGTKITTEKQFTYLNVNFYYVSFVLNGETVYAYIPTGFTVNSLSEEYSPDTFILAHCYETDLFLNNDLTEKIATLENNTEIRILERTDNVLYVSVDISGIRTYGYISSNLIIDNATVNLKNAIIIFVVIAVVCASSLIVVSKIKKNK